MAASQVVGFVKHPDIFPDVILVLVVVGGVADAVMLNPIPDSYTVLWFIALFWRWEHRLPRTRNHCSRKEQLHEFLCFARSRSGEQRAIDFSDGHVVFLTSYIPPHTLGVYLELAKTRAEANGSDFDTDGVASQLEARMGSLNVKIQRTLTFRRPWRHPRVSPSRRPFTCRWIRLGCFVRCVPT